MVGIPKLRIEGFSDAWEQRKLGDVVERVTRKNSNLESNLPLTISAQYGLIDQNEFFDRRIASKDVSGYYLIKHGEFAYNKSTSNDAEWGAIKRLDRYEKGVLSTLYIVFKILDEKQTSSDFLATYYDTNLWHKGIQAIAAEGARNHGLLNIAPSDFFNTSLMMPKSYLEQNKIGEFFLSLNKLITLHQRKCECLKNAKKFFLQNMFPSEGDVFPKLRIAGFTDAWEQRKFIDFAQRESTLKMSSSDCPSVEYEDVIAEEGRLNKDIRQKEILKTGIYFNGSQVLYGKLRPYLHNWLNPDFAGVAVGDWWVLRPSNMDKSFLYRLLQTDHFDAVANQSSGSKMPRADWKLVSNTEFIVPHSEKEQHKIAEFFNSIDDLITLHQRKCDALKNAKKFFLQNMFV